MRWADLGGVGPDGKQHGLSIINNSKYGYDAVGNVLRLTLLRSPVDPDPEADRGHHHFSYAIYPHAGTWKDAHQVPCNEATEDGVFTNRAALSATTRKIASSFTAHREGKSTAH